MRFRYCFVPCKPDDNTSSINPLTSSGFGRSIAQDEYRNLLMIRGSKGISILNNLVESANLKRRHLAPFLCLGEGIRKFTSLVLLWASDTKLHI